MTALNVRVGLSSSASASSSDWMVNNKDRLLLSKLCLILQDIAHSLESISALKWQTIPLLLPLHSPSHTGKKKVFFVDTGHSRNVLQEVCPLCPSKH